MALTGTAPNRSFEFIARQRNISLWALALIAFVLVWQWGPAWSKEWPAAALLPAKAWIGGFMDWLVDSANFGFFTFQQATRFVAAIIDVPYQLALGLLSDGLFGGQGDAPPLVPPLSWIAVVAILTLIGH